jgi:hypothetical protein
MGGDPKCCGVQSGKTNHQRFEAVEGEFRACVQKSLRSHRGEKG